MCLHPKKRPSGVVIESEARLDQRPIMFEVVLGPAELEVVDVDDQEETELLMDATTPPFLYGLKALGSDVLVALLLPVSSRVWVSVQNQT